MSMPPPVPGEYEQPVQPKPKNWWLIGCGGCLGLVVVVAIIGGLIAYSSMKKVRASDAFQQAFRQVQDAPQVQEKLGTPITAGDKAAGVVSETSGTAAFGFAVTGPKAGGKVIYAGEKKEGVWQAKALSVIVDGTNEPIEVVKPETSTKSDAGSTPATEGIGTTPAATPAQ